MPYLGRVYWPWKTHFAPVSVLGETTWNQSDIGEGHSSTLIGLDNDGKWQKFVPFKHPVHVLIYTISGEHPSVCLCVRADISFLMELLRDRVLPMWSPLGTHKRTYRIRSNVHSRISSTQYSVYSIYFYNLPEIQELDLHEIGLKYQGLQQMCLKVISSTLERSKELGLQYIRRY